jgi:hypothetical protein
MNCPGLLEEEILRLLPVESVVHYTLAKLVNDTLFDILVSYYQQIMEALTKRITSQEFRVLYSTAVMANSENVGCP